MLGAGPRHGRSSGPASLDMRAYVGHNGSTLNPLRSVLERLAHNFADALLRAVAGSSPLEAATIVGVMGAGASTQVTGDGRASAGAKLVATLTARERMIFEGALHGASNGTLSRNLGISVKTVQTHRAKINLKLGVHSPAELIRFAVMHGMLTPGHAAASAPGTGVAPTFNLAEVERQTIEAALRATNQDRARAAALLGIPASLLAWKLLPAGSADRPATAPESVTRRVRESAGASRRRVPSAGGGTSRRRARSPGRVVEPKPADEDPAGAITDPWSILDTLGRREAQREAAETPPPTRRSEPEPAPRRERRPAVRPGEDILVANGGGLVLRRRRSTTAAG